MWCAEKSGGGNNVLGVLTVTHVATSKYATSKSDKSGMTSWPRLFLAALRAAYRHKVFLAKQNTTRMPPFPQPRYFLQGHVHFVKDARFTPSQEHSCGGECARVVLCWCRGCSAHASVGVFEIW